MNNEASRFYKRLCRLMQEAGYLSLSEVALTLKLTPRSAAMLLAQYYWDHPDAKRREHDRLRNKAGGGYF